MRDTRPEHVQGREKAKNRMTEYNTLLEKKITDPQADHVKIEKKYTVGDQKYYMSRRDPPHPPA